MKKKKIIIITLLCIAMIPIGKILFSKLIEIEEYYNYASRLSNLGMEQVPMYDKKEIRSLTAGLPADGTTYIIYYYNKGDGEKITSAIKERENWNKIDDSKKVQYYMTMDEMKNIKNGYYYYCNLDLDVEVFDRNDAFKNKELGGRGAKEYFIIAYDTDNNVMYYYQWDV